MAARWRRTGRNRRVDRRQSLTAIGCGRSVTDCTEPAAVRACQRGVRAVRDAVRRTAEAGGVREGMRGQGGGDKKRVRGADIAGLQAARR